MDWQRYSILYTIFGSVILNKPETNIAQLAMVIMRMNSNEIEFMSIYNYHTSWAMFDSGVLN